MLKHIVLCTAIALAPLAAHAEMAKLGELPAGNYTLDPSHASLHWKVNHLGLSNYTARFTKMDATITLDPADITKSTLTATVDPASLETDFVPTAEHDFNKKLKGEKWFEVAKFPEIRFVSTSIEKTSDTTGKIHGNLTFLGVTKPLTLDATFNGGMVKHPFTQDAALGVSATATLKRSDWGFNEGTPYVGDDVQLLIETEFFKAK